MRRDAPDPISAERRRQVFANVNTTVFDRPGMVSAVVVEAGERLFFLVRGRAPILGPVDGVGIYAVPIDELRRDAALPVLAVVVPADHEPDWRAVPAWGVARMLDRAKREAIAIRESGARLQ